MNDRDRDRDRALRRISSGEFTAEELAKCLGTKKLLEALNACEPAEGKQRAEFETCRCCENVCLIEDYVDPVTGRTSCSYDCDTCGKFIDYKGCDHYGHIDNSDVKTRSMCMSCDMHY